MTDFQIIKELQQFDSCDISDALLKLKVPQAGFIPDLKLQTPSRTDRVFARVCTVLFAPKSHAADTFESISEKTNIRPDSHYVDLTPTVPLHAVLMSAPQDAICAVLGGIMALRMHRRGASAIITDGRVRDLSALRQTNIPIWSGGTSTVGAGEGTKVWARQVPVTMRGVQVEPGDIVCADPREEGVVVIPQVLVGQVLELCPKLTKADEKVLEDVGEGSTVKEAFAKHRGNV